jgi:RimJ/RimL family protein N-acetyltransferase
VKTRDLEWGDFPSLVENYFALYDEVNENPDVGISLFPKRPTIGEEADWFVRLFKAAQDGSSVAVVAEEGGRTIGLCSVLPAGNLENQHIGGLGVLVARDYRGIGVGKALMREALERCRGKFEVVTLSVFQTNSSARKLYESLGFRAWGTLPKGVKRNGRNIDLVFMISELK